MTPTSFRSQPRVLASVGDGLADLLADLGGRDAHVRDVAERLAGAVDELVVDRHHLEVVGLGLGGERRAELHVGRADDEALGALRAEVVDGRQRLLAVLGADLDDREALLLAGLVGELPLVLEPGFLGLLHDEADLGLGRRADSSRRRRPKGRRGSSDRSIDA